MDPPLQSADAELLFNPLSPDYIRNPYPHYVRLREHDPMHVNAHGAFVASRHADVTTVLRDKRFGKDYVERTIRRYGPKIMDEPIFRGIDLPAEMTLDRLSSRQTLLQQIDEETWHAEAQPAIRGFTGHHRLAFDLITSAPIRAAFSRFNCASAARASFALSVSDDR